MGNDETCWYCEESMDKPILVPGRVSSFCHEDCFAELCAGCGEGITVDEDSQFCGNDVYFCEDCTYKDE